MTAAQTTRKHGFRLSVWDGVVLVLGAILTIWVRKKSFPLWWIIPMALGHFFLFCNVFLVWRRWELLWAAVFVVNTALHLALGVTDGVFPLLWQLPVTAVVILMQIRSPWYHGIFAKHLNPHLPNFLSGRLDTPNPSLAKKW
jgi:hypothetical protein